MMIAGKTDSGFERSMTEVNVTVAFGVLMFFVATARASGYELRV